MMPPVPDPDDAVVTECTLEAPPAAVWRALSEPHLVAEWLMPNDLRAEAGARFVLTADGAQGGAVTGAVTGEVLVADPPRTLAYTWRREADASGGPALDTVVRFELTPIEGGRTRLRIVHHGFETGTRAARPTLATSRGCAAPRRTSPHPWRSVRRWPLVTARRRAA